jgi:hypothetical protein
MIYFSYIHVPTNQKLEQFTTKRLQHLLKNTTINKIQVTFKKIFDIKNRTREVASIIISTKNKNICCEIESLRFKKSVDIAVNSLKNTIHSDDDRISA